MPKVPLAFVVRPMAPGDRAPVLSLAKTLRKWFNETGLAQMARDVESHRGYVAVRDGVVGFITWIP